MLILLLASATALAYANGANDNFKGVATLLGSRTTGFRRALNWGCWTTLAGSVSALWSAQGLLAAFSGKGLVPDSVAGNPEFLSAVGLGAAATVLLATRVGLPVSTTHSLTGALAGAGLVCSAGQVDFLRLGSAFFLPLLVSPLLAMILASTLYLGLRAVRLKLGVDKESCLCLGSQVLESVRLPASREMALRPVAVIRPNLAPVEYCRHIYLGRFLGFSLSDLMDKAHYLSAGAVGFARGLNDTPKIAALLFAGQTLAPESRFAVVAAMIALGGWLSSRRVADTLSHRVTAMNAGQGLSANLATAFFVTAASRTGLPVSTTHVSVGSLFGIGTITGGANRPVIRAILLSWVGTLPLAALLAAVIAVAGSLLP